MSQIQKSSRAHNSTFTNATRKSLSPIKATAERMQMLRRDVKPGNGTSLLTYQNHASLRRQLAEAKPAVDARASDFYLKEKVAAPERYMHTRNKEMDELRKENNRLFGRLLNIYEKKPANVRDHRPGSLSVTKNKLENAKISQENLILGSKLIKMGSDVPDQKRITEFESRQNYLRNLTYRVDRNQRADPLIRHTALNKSRYVTLDSSGYGRSRKQNQTEINGLGLMEDHSSSVLFSMAQTLQDRPLSMQGVVQTNDILIQNTSASHGRKSTLEPVHPPKKMSPRKAKGASSSTAQKARQTNKSLDQGTLQSIMTDWQKQKYAGAKKSIDVDGTTMASRGDPTPVPMQQTSQDKASISGWENGRESALNKDSIIDGESDQPLASPMYTKQRSGYSRLSGQNNPTANNSRFDGNQAALNSIWNNKRGLDPKKLNTIKKRQLDLADVQVNPSANQTAPQAKFVKTNPNWNTSGLSSEVKGVLPKRERKSVVSDFRGVRTLGLKDEDATMEDNVSDEQLQKHSTMANTATRELTTATGFKNIQDYLQEANLYSNKKSERFGDVSQGLQDSINGSQQTAGGAIRAGKRKTAGSVNTKKIPLYMHSVNVSRRGTTVLKNHNNLRQKMVTPRGPTKQWSKQKGQDVYYNTLFI